jgi:hypothetical protein
MKSASDILIKLLGILLLAAGVLKGWQLLTKPTVGSDIWSYRPFLILTVELEIALAIWFLSGLFHKVAWLCGLFCFFTFSLVTLYKGMTGAESCGCFGSIRVDPWITLYAIDLPALIALFVLKPPKGEKFFEWPSFKHVLTFATIGLVIISFTTPILALNEPARVTSSYEVIEPENWKGRKLPILNQIDIGMQLEDGNWIVLLYRHNCPDCEETKRMYEQISDDLQSIEGYLRIALIEVPPWGTKLISKNDSFIIGQLVDTKKWFVTIPTVILLRDGKVEQVWEKEAPDFVTIIESITIVGDHNKHFVNCSRCCKHKYFRPGKEVAL